MADPEAKSSPVVVEVQEYVAPAAAFAMVVPPVHAVATPVTK